MGGSRSFLEELLNKYSEDSLDGIADKILFAVEEEEKRVVWYMIGICY